MNSITFTSQVTVELIDHMGGDLRVVEAARISTRGVTGSVTGAVYDPSLGGHASDTPLYNQALNRAELSVGDQKLVQYLMRERHGSPFEHSTMVFRVKAPIFVFREMMRHRIASYNEESGRYKQLAPEFYIPARDRNLQQKGKPGAYQYYPGTDYQYNKVEGSIIQAASDAYHLYEEMLAEGVTREVARMVLPVNIYSSAYVTMNFRALMNFLSLRTTPPKGVVTAFASTPMREIEMVAQQMEVQFKELAPVTWEAFNNSGRVAP